MSGLPETLFEKCNAGDYILGFNLSSIYEIVRSGDVMPEAEKTEEGWILGTMEPDATVMRCHWIHPDLQEKHPDAIGEFTIDYFKTPFYGPFEKGFIDVIIHRLDN